MFDRKKYIGDYKFNSIHRHQYTKELEVSYWKWDHEKKKYPLKRYVFYCRCAPNYIKHLTDGKEMSYGPLEDVCIDQFLIVQKGGPMVNGYGQKGDTVEIIKVGKKMVTVKDENGHKFRKALGSLRYPKMEELDKFAWAQP